MYNKLFTKILDSSIWLASDVTRLVWITMIAAMDEDGFCAFATVANLAARARVEENAAEKAVSELESPEPSTATDEDDGRRIERVPGGWMVLNSTKYRDMVTRIVAREQTRARVRKFRDKKGCNASPLHVTVGNDLKRSVTPSEAVSVSVSCTEASREKKTFKPPTKDEAEKYGSEIELPPLEIAKFLSRGESNGWMVGKNPMKSWKAAMRTWKYNIPIYAQPSQTGRPNPAISVDRNSGTYNAGKASDYRNAAANSKGKLP